MKQTDISLETVTELASPHSYNHDDVINQLEQNHSQWLASIREQFDGDWEALIASIIALMRQDNRSLKDKILGRPLTTCTPLQSRKRISIAFALLYAGCGEGFNVIKTALKSKETSTRDWALYHAKDIRSWISRPIGKANFPFKMEELLPALSDALQVLDTEEAIYAVEPCIGLWVDHSEYLHLLAPLRRHKEPRVFLSVIRQFSAMRCDEGTLDIIASHLHEPGVFVSKDLRGGGIHTTRDLCGDLSFWAQPTNSPAQRQRATQIATKIILEALNSSNAVERLAESGVGWFGIDNLFDILRQSKSEQAINLFVQIAEDSRLAVFTRASALVSHKIMTGIVLETRQVLIHDLLAMDSGFSHHSMHLCVKELSEHRLVSVTEVLANAVKPNWTWIVTESISQRSDGDANDASIVKALSNALAQFGGDYPQYKEEIRYLGNTLMSLPRTTADDTYIRQSINAALTSVQRRTDEPWLAQEVQKLLLNFGGGDTLDLGTMNPWDAMREHWRREAITRGSAAQLMIDAGAMDSVAQIDQPQYVHDAQKIVDVRGQVESLLLAGGRACFQSLSDIGYEHHHDRLFATLTTLVRPSINLDAIVQQGDMRFESVLPSDQPNEALQLGIPVFTTEGTRMKVLLHVQKQSYEFYASPNGTHMDVWAVLHAFNQFMEQINRSERVFWLGNDGDGDDWAYLVCALPDKFIAACEKLRLPVRQPRLI